jgi:hypothetical protein
LISSGDYPDQHLHFFKNFPGTGFLPADQDLGVIHDGSQQLTLGDINRDGAPDLAVGQTFFRLNAEQIGGRSPHLRILVNGLAKAQHTLSVRLIGDGKRVNRNALGAIVKAELPDGRTQMREMVGIGGHAGKQHDFVVFFGLGGFDHVKSLEVLWPDRNLTRQRFNNVRAGYYEVAMGKALKN